MQHPIIKKTTKFERLFILLALIIIGRTCGGNCNPATGDFSFGIEGFAFNDGKISHPVREMLITGNMMTLWNSFIAAGTDARECTRWQIPSLAFDDVSFSA